MPTILVKEGHSHSTMSTLTKSDSQKVISSPQHLQLFLDISMAACSR